MGYEKVMPAHIAIAPVQAVPTVWGNGSCAAKPSPASVPQK